MTIGLGVYDIFSRIVPGGFYLFVFVQFAVVMGWLKLDWKILNDANVLSSVGILLVAYIIGAGMDRVGSNWHRLFRKRGMSNRILKEFKENHADKWELDFDDRDWPILMYYIRIRNPDVADGIDRNNALCIMLRNLSFGLLLLAVTELVHAKQTGDWVILILVIFLLFLSIQIALHAKVLRTWFYNGIFQTIVAYRIDIEQRVKPIQTPRRRTNPK